jgi:catechol 2,3-dioxygenase-like lactoylglutathione lyase family enzyme
LIARGLDHVSVSVAILERSVAFYHGLLGIPVLGQGEDDGPTLPGPRGPVSSRFRFADLDLGAGQILELLQYLKPRRKAIRATVYSPGSGHIGIRVGELDKVLARLKKAGIHPLFSPVVVDAPAWWAGARVVYVSDPDGTTVELVERS